MKSMVTIAAACVYLVTFLAFQSLSARLCHERFKDDRDPPPGWYIELFTIGMLLAHGLAAYWCWKMVIG